ncbi:hypothetical protein AB0M22_15950 [Nocardia sp. NPDC051756]|uniref:hypothetical protein n=1 Tax=Nocardia sp. NPDC051756 TaxID=3154751 RepID=UPI003430530C
MTTTAGRRRPFILATCAALVLAAIGDAGPEIIESRSLLTGYDGPGPLIYLGFAVLVATVRWRYIPLTAVAMSLFFLVGGFADEDFPTRLVTPAEPVEFLAAWLQTISFAAAILFGIAAVRRRTPADGAPRTSSAGRLERHWQ